MWDVASCRKTSLGSPDWYPAFDMETGGCRNDGNEPLLFQRYEGYLFPSLEECCETYYPWNVEDCLDPSDHDPCYSFMEMYDAQYHTSPERGYFPVWDDDEIYCINVGDPPGYMVAFPEAWKHQTREQCCRVNFQFVFEECMGDTTDQPSLNACPDSIVETVDHTMKWYVIYPTDSDPECVQDCSTGPDCHSWPNNYEELYESYSVCCENHIWWVENSRCSRPTLTGAEDEAEHTLQWFVLHHVNKDPECVQDCAIGPDCSGLSTDYHNELYSSFGECCSNHLWWVENSPCPLS